MSKELEALEDIILYLNAKEPKGLYCENIETIQQALLNAEKDEKIILGIEDYINRRIKVEPLEDVRKAFIEIRNQLQVIKEVLEWFLKYDHW